MELSEMQKHWEHHKSFSEKQVISPQKIEELIRKRVRRTLLKTLWPELLITVLGGYFAFLILAFFGLLNSVLLQILGGLFIATWICLSGYRLFLLTKLYKFNNSLLPPFQIYEKTLQNRLKFERVQLWTPASWIFLVVVAGVLSVKIYNEYDVTQDIGFWAVVLTIAISLSMWYHYKLKPYYSTKINQAQTLLEDLIS